MGNACIRLFLTVYGGNHQPQRTAGLTCPPKHRDEHVKVLDSPGIDIVRRDHFS